MKRKHCIDSDSDTSNVSEMDGCHHELLCPLDIIGCSLCIQSSRKRQQLFFDYVGITGDVRWVRVNKLEQKLDLVGVKYFFVVGDEDRLAVAQDFGVKLASHTAYRQPSRTWERTRYIMFLYFSDAKKLRDFHRWDYFPWPTAVEFV